LLVRIAADILLYILRRTHKCAGARPSCLPELGGEVAVVGGKRRVSAMLALSVLVVTGCRGISGVTANPGADGPGGVDTRASNGQFAMTRDGRYIAFAGLANFAPNVGTMAVYVRDLSTNVTTNASSPVGLPHDGINGATNPSISDDGRYLAFASDVSNLVAGDTNHVTDIFVRDRLLGSTVRIDVSSGGAQSAGPAFEPAISGNGRYVAFRSAAADLVANDTNHLSDIFVHDLVSGTTERVSVASDGTQANGGSFEAAALNADGRFVIFSSGATNFVPNDNNNNADVFVHDRNTGSTQDLSVTPAGLPGDLGGDNASISSDGANVAFTSASNDLVAGDTNGSADVFVRNLQTNATQRVSLTSSSSEITGGDSLDASISGDGNRIVFGSISSNVVPNDTNGVEDVFVRDLQSGTTLRADVTNTGVEANARAFLPRVANGAGPIGFVSAADNLDPEDHDNNADLFLRTADGSVRVGSRKTTTIPNAPQSQPVLDTSGGVLGFVTDATNLVSVTNAPGSVMVRDLPTKLNELVSVQDNGFSAPLSGFDPALSADGGLVAFTTLDSVDLSDSNFSYDVYVRDRSAGTSDLVSVATNGTQGNDSSHMASMSDDGRYVSFLSTATNLVPGDTNGVEDVFVRDRVAGTTTRVDLSTMGAQADASVLGAHISSDGSTLVFWTAADNLVAGDTNSAVDVFVRDLVHQTTTRVSVDGTGLQANGPSRNAVIDHSGQVVAFESDATNLVASDGNGATDVFVHDLTTGSSLIISHDAAGAAASGSSSRPSISNDGIEVAFQSDASNLISTDTNGFTDVFVRSLASGKIDRASQSGVEQQADGPSQNPALSGDGNRVAFETGADNILPSDLNGLSDVVVAGVRIPT
jgi:hypothetical protein